MRLFSHSRPAYAQRENQDYIEVRRVGNMRLVALADGQGGREGGALAARLGAQSALNWLERCGEHFDNHVLRTAISVADEAVEAEPDAGYSTLIVLAWEPNRIAGASVGDSMGLHITSSGIYELTERQRKNPPLGSGSACGTSFAACSQEDEQILLMSDGVFRFCHLDTIAQICRESEDFDVLPNLLALQQIKANAVLPDDWSAVLLRL